MTRSPRLRRLEIALWFLGLALVGFASGETWSRWSYQAEQERVLEREPALSVPVPKPAVAKVADVVEPAKPAKELPVKVVETPASPVEKKPRVTKVAARSSAFGRIEIPRIGVRAIVKEGADEKTLARAVGLVPGSARPGEIGNMVLAGHRDTFFWPLRKIKVNDRIRMVVPPNTYEYRVQSLRVVAPEETSVLASNGVEELTLVTCYPFRFIGSAPERFIVSAARVN
ncbi:MAG TPA: class D sortase [Thermoanaerobaculia bacterium]|jgi:sortase A|nr:class D sortase [Thermoanaerobaculia bacterium]